VNEIEESRQLAKSDYIDGLQCPLKLWFNHHRRDLRPPVTEQQQAEFDTAHEVKEYAKNNFLSGVEVNSRNCGLEKAIRLTKQAVSAGHETIFEAMAQAPDGTYSHIDILRKHPRWWWLGFD